MRAGVSTWLGGKVLPIAIRVPGTKLLPVCLKVDALDGHIVPIEVLDLRLGSQKNGFN